MVSLALHKPHLCHFLSSVTLSASHQRVEFSARTVMYDAITRQVTDAT